MYKVYLEIKNIVKYIEMLKENQRQIASMTIFIDSLRKQMYRNGAQITVLKSDVLQLDTDVEDLNQKIYPIAK